mmetsp:Transcript_22314/g.31032  ORF Transcript_22314/g.31032 Transcript_22314/m.31032 type:complete len:82 (+) Transcript_22314:261-506(+)
MHYTMSRTASSRLLASFKLTSLTTAMRLTENRSPLRTLQASLNLTLLASKVLEAVFCPSLYKSITSLMTAPCTTSVYSTVA